MNVYLSSAYSSNVYDNSKSCFSNTLPLSFNRNETLELRSLLLDSRLSYVTKYNVPLFILSSSLQNFNEKENSLYKTELREDISFKIHRNSIADFKVTYLVNGMVKAEHVTLAYSEFVGVTSFITDANTLLRKFGIIIGIKNYKFYIQKERIRDADNNSRTYISFKAALANDLGFSIKPKRNVSYLLIPGRKISAKYEPVLKKIYYTFIWIKQCDVEDSSDLCSFLSYILKDVAGLHTRNYLRKKIEYIELDSKTNKLLDVLDIHILVDFFKSITVYEDKDKGGNKFRTLGIEQEYYNFPINKKIPVKELIQPKLIKIFCNQISHASSLTSSALSLIGVLPYNTHQCYKYETQNPLKVSLYNSQIENLTFRITDENEKQLQLTSGVPTFIHCYLSPKEISMHKICYFNSKDSESLKYFPSNSPSRFTQRLLQPIEARVNDFYASLDSIFIPPGIHNINSEYTHIKVFQNESVIEPNIYLESGYYTEESLIIRLNEKINFTGLKIVQDGRYLKFLNSSSSKIELLLNSQFSYLLGYTTSMDQKTVKLTILGTEEIVLFYSYKFSSLATRLIKVKSDFIVDSLLGNSFQPIFRVINLDVEKMEILTNNNSGHFISFPSKHWVKIQPNLYNNISLSLTDENDIPLSFSSNVTAVEGVFTVKSTVEGK